MTTSVRRLRLIVRRLGDGIKKEDLGFGTQDWNQDSLASGHMPKRAYQMQGRYFCVHVVGEAMFNINSVVHKDGAGSVQ